jgi:hypothetical protein
MDFHAAQPPYPNEETDVRARAQLTPWWDVSPRTASDREPPPPMFHDERQVLSLRNQAHGPAISHTITSAGQSLFGGRPVSPVRIFVLPLGNVSACSALGLVPLGTLTSLPITVREPDHRRWLNQDCLQHPQIPWKTTLIKVFCRAP